MVGKVTSMGMPSTSCHFTTSKQEHKNHRCYAWLGSMLDFNGTIAYNITRNHEQVSPLNTQHLTSKKQWLFKVICSMRGGKNVVHCHCITDFSGCMNKMSQQIYGISCIICPSTAKILAPLGSLKLGLDIQWVNGQISQQTAHNMPALD